MSEDNHNQKSISQEVIKRSKLNQQTLSSIEHDHASDEKLGGPQMSGRTIKTIASIGAFLSFVGMVIAATIIMKVLF